MRKSFSRTQRVSQLLREEIARLLEREVKDVRVREVTVSGVEVSSDLKYADIYVQVHGGEAERQSALAGLESAAGFMRSRLGRELRIRRIPELRFSVDQSYQRAARIAELLDQAKKSSAMSDEDASE